MKFARLLQYIAALTQPWIAGKLASAALEGGGGNDLTRIQQILLLWLGLISLKSILNFCASDLLEQRTVILITHRPATMVLANRAVKMQDARVMPGAHF